MSVSIDGQVRMCSAESRSAGLAKDNHLRHLVLKRQGAHDLKPKEIEAIQALPHNLRPTNPGRISCEKVTSPLNVPLSSRVMFTGSSLSGRAVGRFYRSII